MNKVIKAIVFIPYFILLFVFIVVTFIFCALGSLFNNKWKYDYE
jgi:hypothetical protein